MRSVSGLLADFRTPLRVTQKRCEKHGVDYEERVYRKFTRGCPLCAQEAEERLSARLAEERAEAAKLAAVQAMEKRIGYSRIPPRFADKTVKGYVVDEQNELQVLALERVKAFGLAFAHGVVPDGSLAMLGNTGTGKTHLACAIGNHVIRNCGGSARYTTVSELFRLVREAKSFSSVYSETQVIEAFAGYDLLIIDEIGMQSGSDAESRALFDVFNERYQHLKPTILISNLKPEEFEQAVGKRITDRVAEGGCVLLFNWGSYRA